MKGSGKTGLFLFCVMNKCGLLTFLLMIIGLLSVACDSTPDRKPGGRQGAISTLQAKNICLFSGIYDVMRDGKIIGYEDFEAYQLESGKILVRSESVLDYGYKYQHNAEYTCDSEWNIEHAVIKYHGGGLTRTTIIKREDGRFYCRLSTGDGRIQEYEFENAPEYVIRYGLLVFAIPVLKKLDIGTGQSKELHTIFIESSSLKAFDAIFRYEILEEGIIEVPAGRFEAREFSVTDRQGKYKRYFWANSENIIISCGEGPEGNDIYRLSRYSLNRKTVNPSAP